MSAQCPASAHSLHRNQVPDPRPPPHTGGGAGGGDQAAVAVTPSPRHTLSTRYLEAERPVSTLCGSSSHVTVTEAKPPCPCLPSDARPVSAPPAGAGCCRVRGRRNQTRDSPCAGLGWDPATDVNWGPNMGMPPGHPGPGHAAADTRAHVSPKQLSYFHVNHKILPNEMDDSTFS